MLWFIVGAVIVIMAISKGIARRKKDKVKGRAQTQNEDRERSPKHRMKKKKEEGSENDVGIMTVLLSAGLVDIDPTLSSMTLGILRKYRDLRSGST